MNITELSGTKLSDAEQRTLVIAAIKEKAPLLNYVPWTQIVGNAITLPAGYSIAGVGNTRAMNTDFTPRRVDFGEITVGLKILGDEVKTDIAYLRRGIKGFGAKHAEMLQKWGNNLGLYLQQELIKGSGTGTDIAGLKSLVPTDRVITLGSANGHQVIVGTSDIAKKSQAIFLRALKKAILSVQGGPSCLIMNSNTIALLYDIAKERIIPTSITDVYNNIYQVPVFDGVPIVDAGFKTDEDGLVIGNDEQVGTSNDCTSIYMPKYGTEQDVMVITSTGIDVINKGMINEAYVTRVEFDAGQGLQNKRAIAKVAGLRFDL